MGKRNRKNKNNKKNKDNNNEANTQNKNLKTFSFDVVIECYNEVDKPAVCEEVLSLLDAEDYIIEKKFSYQEDEENKLINGEISVEDQWDTDGEIYEYVIKALFDTLESISSYELSQLVDLTEADWASSGVMQSFFGGNSYSREVPEITDAYAPKINNSYTINKKENTFDVTISTYSSKAGNQLSSDEEQYNKSQGVVLGVAVGDAIGGTTEFMSPDQILNCYNGPVADMIGGGVWNLRPGQITDDTGMMLALQRSLDTSGEYSSYAALYQYLEWYHAGPIDIGATVRSILAKAAAGYPAEWAAEEFHYRSGGKSAGNGSLMRIAPIAVKYKDDLNKLRQATIADSKITHYDDLAAEACVYYNTTIAGLINNDNYKLEVPTNHMIYQSVTADVNDIKRRVDEEMGFVLTALAVGMYAVKHAESYEEGILWATNLGGDADTNAAVAGALLGAKFGAENIPERWREKLEDKTELLRLNESIFNNYQPLGKMQYFGEPMRAHKKEDETNTVSNSSNVELTDSDLESLFEIPEGTLKDNPKLKNELIGYVSELQNNESASALFEKDDDDVEYETAEEFFKNKEDKTEDTSINKVEEAFRLKETTNKSENNNGKAEKINTAIEKTENKTETEVNKPKVNNIESVKPSNKIGSNKTELNKSDNKFNFNTEDTKAEKVNAKFNSNNKKETTLEKMTREHLKKPVDANTFTNNQLEEIYGLIPGQLDKHPDEAKALKAKKIPKSLIPDTFTRN